MDDFLAEGANRVARMADVLRGPDRTAALSAASRLTVAEQQQLLPEWVHLARCAHGPFILAWAIVEALPRAWVVSHIEPEVDAILRREEEADYWMFLQLYERLDRDLALRLARRAAAHADPDIRELGAEYLERLGEPAGGVRGASA